MLCKNLSSQDFKNLNKFVWQIVHMCRETCCSELWYSSAHYYVISGYTPLIREKQTGVKDTHTSNYLWNKLRSCLHHGSSTRPQKFTELTTFTSNTRKVGFKIWCCIEYFSYFITFIKCLYMSWIYVIYVMNVYPMTELQCKA